MYFWYRNSKDLKVPDRKINQNKEIIEKTPKIKCFDLFLINVYFHYFLILFHIQKKLQNIEMCKKIIFHSMKCLQLGKKRLYSNFLIPIIENVKLEAFLHFLSE